MIVRFNEKVSYQLDETNTYVEQVRIGMTYGGDAWNISAGAVTIQCDSATAVVTGSAELTEG